MNGLPVPVADDFEWAREQAKAQYEEYQKQKEEKEDEAD